MKLAVILCLIPVLLNAQKFTHQDSILGSNTAERNWWDVLHYDITVEPNYESKTIIGSNTIRFKQLKAQALMQIDLQDGLQLDSAIFKKKKVNYKRDGFAYYLDLPKIIASSPEESITLFYSGKPREAKNAPWDGGFIWTKDQKGRPWMSVACQGIGASVWMPCKDFPGDEPDKGSTLCMIVSSDLQAVSNGRLVSELKTNNGKKAVKWNVSNPINSYNIIPYIGYYVNWSDTYTGEKGALDCNYWVLDYELEKAKNQFKQAHEMLKCFEHWFGPYPFYEDGYKLIQAPHLGMEHQSGIAYGNGFQNGYYGKDLSKTGWGLKWDFIIVHESGHEWFGNNISNADVADMWIHESFTNYSETIFTECHDGKQAATEYLIGIRSNIKNDVPIIGNYGVRNEGSGDMYYKGGNLIHLIRLLMNDDEKFRLMLREMNSKFYHQTVTTQQIEAFISTYSGLKLDKIFDQYLRTAKIPILEYKVKNGQLDCRWTNCVDGFELPIELENGQKIQASTEWKSFGNWTKKQKLIVHPAYYVNTKHLL